MPSIWRKVKEYCQWFLWGKTPYSQLSDHGKKEARRDLYCRLFIIANAPYFATVYGTFVLSMGVSSKLADLMIKVAPERDIWKKCVGGFCFGTYIVLHVITMGAGMMYITFPFYIYVFNTSYSFVTRKFGDSWNKFGNS
ncbi:hypothetical protein GCK72_016545 [Caenorhabditis remanei]|uniref:Uncharacterized protein n=1 Tax=Caenorhabditis remanei TaxID=31234 RepID=A0A6A5G4X9_CAERE|nr:hypothetical protein GCK72_016545 [Caenorhabditis remanei]KAF1750000.1 hypothetical protein GCK72_016545 [Caenorhabditis remanei]